MATSEAWKKRLVAIADVTFGTAWANLDGLGIGAAAWSANITTLEKAEFARFFYQIKTGTAPTANKAFDFWISQADDDATNEIRAGSELIGTASGTSTVTADNDRVEMQLHNVHSQRVDASANKVYTGYFDVPDPGSDLTLWIRNNLDQAFNGTASPHRIHVIGYGPQGQAT